MEPVTLRGYRKTDLDAMFRLDEQCFAEPFRFSLRAMRGFAQAKYARVVIAEVGPLFAGFAILHVEQIDAEKIGYVVTLDVAEPLRRHGIAHQLMAEMERIAASEDCAAIELHVFTDNDGAIRFYEHEGYVRVHTALHFYAAGLHAWIYRKEILR